MSKIKENGIIMQVDKILPLVEGETENGFWQRRQVIVKSLENRNKKLCLTLSGDRVKMADKIRKGMVVQFTMEAQSREYAEGKWATDLHCILIEPFEITAAEAAEMTARAQEEERQQQ